MRGLDPGIPIVERGIRISEMAGTKPGHDGGKRDHHARRDH
jgi:hypothetical protein